MRRINNFGLVPCVVLSIIIHSLIFFVLFYKNSKKNVFIQVPFEVSFYSPIQTKVPEVVEVKEEIKPVEEPKPIEEIKPKEEIKPEVKKKKKKKVVKKDDIVVKKKEKVKKEEPKEEQPVEGNGANGLANCIALIAF